MDTQKSKQNRAQRQVKNLGEKSKGRSQGSTRESRVPRIGPNTPHGVCSERLSGFGGLLCLVKFLDLVKFKEIFDKLYTKPKRQTELGS